MTLEQWALISQIAVAILTFIGVFIALFVAIKTLREVRIDRRLNKLPYLAFEPGGSRYPLEFREIGAKLREKDSLPQGTTSVGLKTTEGRVTIEYGDLRNYGPGPAMATKIVWVAKEVWLGSEKFRLDTDKYKEPKYSEELNTIPSSPSHILPNQTARFFRLPAFISRDYERKITRVSGVIEIKYLDLFKRSHITLQSFYIFPEYAEEPPYIHFTFSDIVD